MLVIMSNGLLRAGVLLLLGLSSVIPLGAGTKETWIEVQSPNFTVISNAGEKEARKIADQFEQFRGVFQNSLPLSRVDLGKPLVIFAVKNEDNLKVLLPGFWEVKGHTHPAGIYVPGEARHTVAVRIDIQAENPYEVVYHEYTHAILDLNFRDLPLWLNEGLAEFFGNSTIEDKTVEVGKIAKYHLQTLQENRLIPVQTLLEADHNSPYYNEQNRANVFYAESWAITHYLMLDPEARKQNLLQKFLAAWEASGNQVEAAQKTFGDLKKFAQAMEAYARQNSFYYGKVSSPAHGDPKSYASRVLSPAEVSAERGIFYLNMQRPEEAGNALQEAVHADPNLPLAHEGLGMLALSQQHMHAAETEFARAIELKSTDYFAYYFYAQAQMRQGIPSEEEQDKVAASLEKAIAMNPQFAPAYSMLSSLYSIDPDKRGKAVELGFKAVKLEPGNLSHAINLCHVLLAAGRTNDAKILAKRIQDAAKTPAERMNAEQILYTIEQIDASSHDAIVFSQRKNTDGTEKESTAAKTTTIVVIAPSDTAKATGSETNERVSGGATTQPERQEYAVAGTIASVECNTSSGGRVTLSISKMSMKFHYADLSALQVLDSKSTDPDKTPACAEWKGRRARLYFYPVKNKDYVGELATIQFF